MSNFDLVIFDCDGVLVDSERLAITCTRRSRGTWGEVWIGMPSSSPVIERELVVVPGVIEALDAISTTTCIASSGSHDKMQFTLGMTGLLDRFEGRIFSVDQVAHGKPAPDVLVFAADQMGVPPSRCAVIEDSVSGVTAGLAALMTVLAFAGGVTSASHLSLEGAIVFDDMRELPQLLAH